MLLDKEEEVGGSQVVGSKAQCTVLILSLLSALATLLVGHPRSARTTITVTMLMLSRVVRPERTARLATMEAESPLQSA